MKTSSVNALVFFWRQTYTRAHTHITATALHNETQSVCHIGYLGWGARQMRLV